ncbi:MAG: flagellin [Alphaproteobacteria bacterium]|nr:flagellin [Alphaproteobacteria bacterium]
MASINTNVSALKALTILNKNDAFLQETQERISTGLKVRSSKDNASTYAIAQGLRSDIKTYNVVSDTLALAQSSLGTGVAAVETIDGLMSEIKAKIVQAQGENVDRNAIQADIDQLVAQIENQVQAAEFNGLNLLNGSGKPFNVMIGFKTVDGERVPDSLNFDTHDIRTTTTRGNGIASNTFAAGATDPVITLDQAYTGEVTPTDGSKVKPGDLKSITFTLQDTVAPASHEVTIDVSAEDDLTAVATKLQTEIRALTPTANFATVTVAADSANGTTLTFGDSTDKITFEGADVELSGGDLMPLAAIDVTTTPGAVAALGEIDGLADIVSDTNAVLGSQQRRLDLQDNFISGLLDSLETGLSALVDADLTKEAVNLNQAQAKQQLGYQALGIANEQTRSVLSLFQ